MDNSPVLHDSERDKGWSTESKKILEEELGLELMDVEGIERVLGTNLENSVDEIRKSEIGSRPKNRVFAEGGITTLGKENVVLEYSQGMTAGELASLLMRGKMLKVDQEMGDVLPGDDGFERRTYEQFVLQLPKDKIEGLNVSASEKEEWARAWHEYENVEAQVEGEIEGKLPRYPGRKRLLTKRHVVSGKPISGNLKNEYLAALDRYQEQREKVLSKVAAKRYNEINPEEDLAQFIHPMGELYGDTMKFINKIEEAKLEKR